MKSAMNESKRIKGNKLICFSGKGLDFLSVKLCGHFLYNDKEEI